VLCRRSLRFCFLRQLAEMVDVHAARSQADDAL